jgi:hypothetical protein
LYQGSLCQAIAAVSNAPKFPNLDAGKLFENALESLAASIFSGVLESRFGTTAQFLDHLTDDVLPAVLNGLSAETVGGEGL